MALKHRTTALEQVQYAINQHGRCARAELTQLRVEVVEDRAVWEIDPGEKATMLYTIDTIMQALDRLNEAWK